MNPRERCRQCVTKCTQPKDDVRVTLSDSVDYGLFGCHGRHLSVNASQAQRTKRHKQGSRAFSCKGREQCGTDVLCSLVQSSPLWRAWKLTSSYLIVTFSKWNSCPFITKCQQWGTVYTCCLSWLHHLIVYSFLRSLPLSFLSLMTLDSWILVSTSQVPGLLSNALPSSAQ